MKRLVVLALLSVLLTGCVKQADYDKLEKENEELKDEIDDLNDEIDDLKKEVKQLVNAQPNDGSVRFLVDENRYSSTNSNTKETIGYYLYPGAKQSHGCIVSYEIPYITDDVLYYELAGTYFETEMCDFFTTRGIETYTISVSTPSEINRDLRHDVIDDEDLGYNIYNRDGTYASDGSDWMLDACLEIIDNGYDNKLLVNTLSEIKSDIDNHIHYY